MGNVQIVCLLRFFCNSMFVSFVAQVLTCLKIYHMLLIISLLVLILYTVKLSQLHNIELRISFCLLQNLYVYSSLVKKVIIIFKRIQHFIKHEQAAWLCRTEYFS